MNPRPTSKDLKKKYELTCASGKYQACLIPSNKPSASPSISSLPISVSVLTRISQMAEGTCQHTLNSPHLTPPTTLNWFSTLAK